MEHLFSSSRNKNFLFKYSYENCLTDSWYLIKIFLVIGDNWRKSDFYEELKNSPIVVGYSGENCFCNATQILKSLTPHGSCDAFELSV